MFFIANRQTDIQNNYRIDAHRSDESLQILPLTTVRRAKKILKRCSLIRIIHTKNQTFIFTHFKTKIFSCF